MSRRLARVTISPVTYVRFLAVAAGIALGVAAYNVQIDNLGPATTTLKAAASVGAAWAFLAAGVAAWSRRPANRAA